MKNKNQKPEKDLITRWMLMSEIECIISKNMIIPTRKDMDVTIRKNNAATIRSNSIEGSNP